MTSALLLSAFLPPHFWADVVIIAFILLTYNPHLSFMVIAQESVSMGHLPAMIISMFLDVTILFCSHLRMDKTYSLVSLLCFSWIYH